LLSKQRLFGIAKEETIDASILAELRIILQAVALLGSNVSDVHKRQLSQAARDAALAGDSQAVRTIRTQVEQELRTKGSNGVQAELK
jgi:hypothetical protein